MQQLSLNLQAGRELRDAGIAQAVASAEEIEPTWSETAYKCFTKWLAEKPVGFEFQIEEFRAQRGHLLSIPPSLRAFGALPVKASKEKLILKTGYAPVSNPTAHAAFASVWIKN